VPYSRSILHQTAPDHTALPRPAAPSPAPSPTIEAERLAEERTAFGELHAARLYGFALVLELGDRVAAAALASDAIDAGVARLHQLRHPERASAWLRERVLSGHRPGKRPSAAVAEARAAALEEIGITEPVRRALATLAPRERAALVADHVEGFDLLDTATIVRQRGRRLGLLLARARRRYAAAFSAGPIASAGDLGDGPLARRVGDAAARALR
jgi:DNA-directed RNA polymerase specialized sigma24 family protein